MVKALKKRTSFLEDISYKIVSWVGTPYSVLVHTLFFISIPMLGLIGLDLRFILLIFTTWLSVEAIYLAIFIQMTVNRNTESLEDVEEDLEAFGEDIEDIQEDVNDEEEAHKILLNIGTELKHIQQDLNTLKKKGLL